MIFEPETPPRLAFDVWGVPVAKGRPRFVRATGRTYTPGETVRYETLVREAARGALPAPGQSGVSGELLAGPLRVEIVAVWPALKGGPKTGRPRAWKTTRPDGDNVAKAILDALVGVVFVDDAQVVDLRVWKLRGATGEAPRAEVRIYDAGEIP